MKLSNRHENCVKPNATIFFSLNSIDFPINKPYPFLDKWFSHKFKGARLRYEIGLCICSLDIIWISRPFLCGKYPDLSIVYAGILN